MKNSMLYFMAVSVVSFLAALSCASESKKEVNKEKKQLSEQYPQVLEDKLMTDSSLLGKRLFDGMLANYIQDLSELKKEVNQTGASFCVCFLTPEVGESLTIANRIGKIEIQNICDSLQIPYYDLTKQISKMNPLEITQMPKDGHWSKKGAEVVASELQKVVKLNTLIIPNKPNEMQMGVLGDHIPNENKILDGGKQLPYKIKINSQGLRMNRDVAVTKKNQRILFFGDSEMFFPFLDNEYMATEILQNKMPDREILNASAWGYTVKDYLDLYKEKAKKSQADVVIVVTNGNDILDYYFSKRNLLGRKNSPTIPTKDELEYYEKYLK